MRDVDVRATSSLLFNSNIISDSTILISSIKSIMYLLLFQYDSIE